MLSRGISKRKLTSAPTEGFPVQSFARGRAFATVTSDQPAGAQAVMYGNVPRPFIEPVQIC